MAGVYICDTCGKEDLWRDTWVHYSSIKDLEGDPYKIPTFCSVECALKHSIGNKNMKNTLLDFMKDK